MGQLTREQLLARKIGHEVVDLGDGSTVKVRGLNRDQAHAMQQLDAGRARDLFMIATGMVAPEMSEEDVAVWFTGDETGAIERVSTAIVRLSGMADGQGKDATKSVPRGRGRGRA